MPRVISLDWLSPDIFEIHLEKEGLVYEAGDCTLLIGPDGIDSRPYSFSSHPLENRISFLIRRIPKGGLTPWLGFLNPGDRVETSSPFGLFAPGREGPAVFIATGTGIAPFLSYLKDVGAPEPRALFYGVRRRENGVYHTWLTERLARKSCNFLGPPDPIYHFVVSGEGEGRVTDLIDQIPLERGLNYYLCGHETMCQEMSSLLLARGVDEKFIHSEIFVQA